jgi:hypothetical protein
MPVIPVNPVSKVGTRKRKIGKRGGEIFGVADPF